MVKGVLRDLLHEKMAIAGLAIIAFLVAMSVYAVVALPPNFPSL